MKNNHTPEIRLPGFTGDWEQRKFKDFISKAGKKNTMGENYLAYSVSNKLGLVSQTEQFDGSRLDDLDKTSYKLVNPNEFAYNPARINVGSIAFNNLNKTVIVSSLYVVLKMSDKLDNEFILQFIKSQSFTDEVRRNTEGSVREYLFFENFKNIKFPYTYNKDEQIKIGNFFKQLDDTIALHQQELTTLKQTKQGFLQKMFPKEGESVPEIRFPGFTGEWKQRKLNEVAEIYDGTHQTPVYKDQGIMFLSVENIKTLKSNKFISEEAFEKEFKIRPEKDDILMTRIGDIGTANVVKDSTPIAYYVSLALIKSKKLNSYFLQSSIHSPFIQNEMWKRTLHIAFPKKINKNEITNVLINFPNIEEQTKIGNFFKQLDDTIALHQRELDALKETKKAFLQKMFV